MLIGELTRIDLTVDDRLRRLIIGINLDNVVVTGFGLDNPLRAKTPL